MNPTTSTFDPRSYLKPLNGKQYLEVVHRVQWLRAEHPEAVITTKLEHLDFGAGWAVFHARVEIPGAGVAEGTGSETRDGFPGGWLEKAETIAVGRALAMLGYGTAFCLDFETAETGNGHLADCPVAPPTTPTNGGGQQQPTTPTNGTARAQQIPNGNHLSTPAQLKLIYLAGTRDAQLTEEELEERCHSQYGRLPLHLSKREASAFIDALKASANGTARAR